MEKFVQPIPDDVWERQADVPLTITKIFPFEAAHQLPFHDGKCKELHGHSYRLEVSLRGDVQPDDPNNPQSGMVIDFGEVKRATDGIVKEFLDHRFLNETVCENPTAERIVQSLVKVLGMRFGVLLVSVKLWETATSSVEWRRGS